MLIFPAHQGAETCIHFSTENETPWTSTLGSSPHLLPKRAPNPSGKPASWTSLTMQWRSLRTSEIVLQETIELFQKSKLSQGTESKLLLHGYSRI